VLDIDFKFPDWADKVRGAEPELNRFLAAQVQTNRGLLFDAEGSRNGHQRWPGLSLRNGQILSQRGKLRKSIAPRNSGGQPGPDGVVSFDGDMIAVGTRLLYAKMMNYGTVGLPGGILKPKHAKALRIPLPAGQSASPKARKARAAPLEKKAAAQKEKLAVVQERAAAARKRFSASGQDRHLEAAVAAEFRVVKARHDLMRLKSRANKIRHTGLGGQGFIFVKWVRIPPRDFISWNAQDQAEIDGALLVKVTEVLNR
jgi:phage gpG-like protein